ncbi:membrane protein [Marinobacter salarius]|uniref:Membrane protein n=2 Tax=Marinobacter salarius TaxID=1420917 RepID=A0A1W6K5S1_9GAMM|nr:membrane protein [Marinobacter salarius]
MTARQIEPLRPALVLGALFALLAVMAGAFGAHGLRGVIDERGLEVFQTAVTYQIYHSLALILVAILPIAGLSRRLLGIAAGFFVAGILLFSGSLYLLVLTDLRWMGPVTPVGGIGFMVGWILVLMAGFRR